MEILNTPFKIAAIDVSFGSFIRYSRWWVSKEI